ncbi:hypothetical protein BH09BAC4_BH09BAC4_02900 [soil metagenome]
MTTESKLAEWVPFSVPVDTAQNWITNWIDADPAAKPLDPTEMRAFVVRRADFVELLAQHDTEFVRLYVGRKEQLDEDRMRPCLLLVSAAYEKDINPDAPDSDVIVDLVGPMTITDGDAATQQTYEVFDFSRPCPPHCNEDSPLFISQTKATGA